MTIKPDLRDKVKKEIKEHLKLSETRMKENSVNWGEVLEYEALSDLKYMGMVLNEALRISPPATASSTVCLTETTEIGGYLINKGDRLAIHFWGL